MSDITIEKNLERYSSCMEEIKRRTLSIEFILNGERSTGYKYTDGEYICLQTRKILELIALANLVSNSEIYSKKHQNFSNHWHPKAILKEIKKINPDYYPAPVKQIIEEKRVETIKEGFLTENEFLEVYSDCSEYMHASNPFSIPKNINYAFNEIPKWLVVAELR